MPAHPEFGLALPSSNGGPIGDFRGTDAESFWGAPKEQVGLMTACGWVRPGAIDSQWSLDNPPDGYFAGV